MEPQTATALFTDDKLEVWVGTQNGEATIAAAAETSGMPLDNVYVHKMHAGGGFGRRGPHQEYTKQAVKIAQSMPGTPVRLQWSREEDMQQGRYRPVSLVKLRGALDKDGNWTALAGAPGRPVDHRHRAARPMIKDGVDPINTRCFIDNPVQGGELHQRVRDAADPCAARGSGAPWRTPTTRSYRECFIDELAHAAGKDPYEFRRPFLEGKKDLGVLDAVAKAIGWGKPAPERHPSRHRRGRFLRQLHGGGGRDLGRDGTVIESSA